MTKHQDSKVAMYRALRNLLNDNKDTINASPALAEAARKLSDNIDSIEKSAQTQSTVSLGKTAIKRDEKASLVTWGLPVMGGLHALAHSRNDITLIEMTDWTENALLRTRDQELTRIWDAILEQAHALEAELAPSGVTPEDIARLQTARDNYYEALHTRDVSVAKRITTGPTLNELIASTDRLLDSTLDNLMMVLRNKQPELYAQYNRTRSPNPPGVRHRPVAETPVADPPSVVQTAPQQNIAAPQSPVALQSPTQK